MLNMEQSKIGTKLGSSLPVPCVQELVRKPLIQVPPQYVRPDIDPSLLSDSSSKLQVPVIDMQKLLSGDSDDELNKFDNACRKWGFFQLVNHGAKKSVIERMKIELEELFNLSMEEKKKLWQEPGDLEGFGQHFVVSKEQKLDWGDLFYLVTLPTHIRKPHVYSALPSSFREVVEEYSEELENLAKKILEQMGKVLGIDLDDIKENYEHGFQCMRMNYYPPCPQPDKVIGLNPHSDASGLTILLQVNEIEGLQVKKNGKWIPVVPLPHAFIINIGDALEIMTNGIYQSIEHRATVNSNKERLSIATFYNPRYDGKIGPAKSLITPQSPAKFTTIMTDDFYKAYCARQLQGKSYLETLGIHNN